MRVLLTGVSSFTGCWFAEALAESGSQVVATCRRSLDTYDQLGRRRIRKALDAGVTLVQNTAFGDDRFLAALRAAAPLDLLCHHGAEVGDFRRPGYDPLTALQSNVRDAGIVFDELRRAGARGLVATGSVFEPDEGCGEEPRPAFNAYGLAKQLSWQTLRQHAQRAGLAVGRFVIPHPFGALEKPGFTRQLACAWLAGKPGIVTRPDLVRDFIHVDFLAAAYASFCRAVVSSGGEQRLGPTGQVGTLLQLAKSLSDELAPRLGCACELRAEAAAGPNSEPRTRCNADPLLPLARRWPFGRSWDRLAEFYLGLKFLQ